MNLGTVLRGSFTSWTHEGNWICFRFWDSSSSFYRPFQAQSPFHIESCLNMILCPNFFCGRFIRTRIPSERWYKCFMCFLCFMWWRTKICNAARGPSLYWTEKYLELISSCNPPGVMFRVLVAFFYIWTSFSKRRGWAHCWFRSPAAKPDGNDSDRKDPVISPTLQRETCLLTASRGGAKPNLQPWVT